MKQNMIDLRKNGVSVETKMLSIDELKKEKYKKISEIISRVGQEFEQERIQKLGLSMYEISRLIENPNFADAVTSSIEKVIIEYAVESRLFRRLGHSFQCSVAGNEIEPGLYEITYLEPRDESVNFSDALEYFEKSGALFLGIRLLQELRQHPEWIKDDSRSIISIDVDNSYYLLNGQICPSFVSVYGVELNDILIHIVKLS